MPAPVQKITIHCEVCGATQLRQLSSVKRRKHFFCSHTCRNSVDGQHISNGFRYDVPNPCPDHYKIYGLFDPRTQSIHYVGASTDTRARLLSHLHSATKTKHKQPVQEWITELRREGIVPNLQILEVVSDKNEWQLREKYWIGHYRRLGADLKNLTDGGKGICGYSFNEQARIKMSQRRTGTIPSAETVRKLSAALKGRTWTAEQKARMAAAKRNSDAARIASVRNALIAAEKRRGKPLSDEWRAAIAAGNKGKQVSIQTRVAHLKPNRDSGFLGVFKRADSGHWRARVGNKMIGTFDTPEAAAVARDKVALEVYGPKVPLNFPQLVDDLDVPIFPEET